MLESWSATTASRSAARTADAQPSISARIACSSLVIATPRDGCRGYKRASHFPNDDDRRCPEFGYAAGRFHDLTPQQLEPVLAPTVVAPGRVHWGIGRPFRRNQLCEGSCG